MTLVVIIQPFFSFGSNVASVLFLLVLLAELLRYSEE